MSGTARVEDAAPVGARRLLLMALLLLPLAYVALFYRLGAPSINIAPVDEAVHTAVTLEMARTGSFTPTWHGRFYYGKPSLKMFVTARLVRALGDAEWVLRLPDACAALVTGLLIMALAARCGYGQPAALLAPVILWTSPNFVFVHGARDGVMDAPLTMLFAAAVVAFMIAIDRGGFWLLLPGVFMAGAALVKTVVGALPAAFGVAVALLHRKPRRLLDPRLWVSLCAPAAAFAFYASLAPKDPEIPGAMRALPAPVARGILVALGDLTTEIWKRLFTGDWGHRAPWWQYLAWFWKGMAPWCPFLAVGFLVGVTALVRRRSGLDAHLVIWALVVLAPFSIAVSKLPWYVFPTYPAAALLAARALAPPEIWRHPRRVLLKALSVLVCVALSANALHGIWRAAREDRTTLVDHLVTAVAWSPGAPLLVHAIRLDFLCPDEEYYISRRGLSIHAVPDLRDLVSLVRARSNLVVLTTEDRLFDVATALGSEMARARVARFPGHCDVPDLPRKHPAPPRALLVFDRGGLPPDFGPVQPIRLADGFYAAEPRPGGGQMQWMRERGAIEIEAEGTVRLGFDVQSFLKEREIVARFGDAEILHVRVHDFQPVETEPFTASGRSVLTLQAVGGCDVVRQVVRGAEDPRCLAVAIAAPRLASATSRTRWPR